MSAGSDCRAVTPLLKNIIAAFYYSNRSAFGATQRRGAGTGCHGEFSDLFISFEFFLSPHDPVIDRHSVEKISEVRSKLKPVFVLGIIFCFPSRKTFDFCFMF